MGTCLDTDQQNGAQVSEDGDAGSAGKWRGEAGLLSTPPNGYFPQQNVGPVKFEVPNVPVIFVLGGPGSGKVTHCDNLMQEKEGITHINMMDLLQQYALGNDMQDFGQLSSKTVAEVLMLEIKMSPGSKVFLVSGYPRNMRDVVEYAEKIKIVNGVILVSWRQEILERQIDFGAQLGQVVIELARMELYNFYRNVMPVAEYFDQSGMLLEVNGERNPSEVYIDFRDAVFKILGFDGGEKREKNMQKSLETEVEIERRKESATPIKKKEMASQFLPTAVNKKPIVASKIVEKQRKGLPAFIWVIGGPGSNKENLCMQAVRNMPGFVHISVGNLLRTMANSNTIIKDAIVSGEMVPQDIVMQLVEAQIMQKRDTDGVVIDGFPRDLGQLTEFENKFGQRPPLVLLDCSKLQLGRGRLDDSVSAFRKRLEIFREVSLPMLKTLDTENRLTIIDGDTDVPSVQNEFASSLYQLSSIARRMEENQPINGQETPNIENNMNEINANANLANSINSNNFNSNSANFNTNSANLTNSTNFNSNSANLTNSTNFNSNSGNLNSNSPNSTNLTSNLTNLPNSTNVNSNSVNLNSNSPNSANLTSNLTNLASNATNLANSTNFNANLTNLTSNLPNSANLTSNFTNLAANATNLANSTNLKSNLPNSTNLTSNLPNSANLTSNLPNSANLTSNLPNSANLTSNLPNSANLTSNLPNSANLTSNLANSANLTSNLANSANLTSNLPNSTNLTSNLTNLASNATNLANSANLTSNLANSANLTSNLTNLAANATNLKSNLTNLTTSTNLNSNLPNSTDLKSNLSNLANSTNSTSLKSNLTNLANSTNSTSLKSNLTNLANSTNLNSSNLTSVKSNLTNLANSTNSTSLKSNLTNLANSTNSNLKVGAKNVIKMNATSFANGVAKQLINEGKNGVEKVEKGKNINGLSLHAAATIATGLKSNARQVQKNIATRAQNGIANGAARAQNGIANGAARAQNGIANGAARAQNGIANGAAHLLQNGVAHLTNGIAANNKVAPQMRNYPTVNNNNAKDALRKMYNEVDGYQENLHM